MKTLSWLIVFALYCTISSAQTYQYVPMATDSAVWQVRAVSVSSGPPHRSLYCFQEKFQLMMDGSDTTINGRTYKKVFKREKTSSTTVPYTGGPPCPLPTVENAIADNPDIFYFGLLDSNKQIFISKTPTPYFDFNLGVGQGTSDMGIIASIDTVLVAGTYRKRFITTYYAQPDTIIEGIGSLRRGIYINVYPGYEQNLDCYTYKSQTIYSAPESGCTYVFPYGTPTSVKAINKGKTTAYPNPFTTELNIKDATGTKAVVYNAMGMKVYEAVIDGKPIQTSHWSSGMYYLVLKDEKGNVSGVQKIIKE